MISSFLSTTSEGLESSRDQRHNMRLVKDDLELALEVLIGKMPLPKR